MNWRGLGSQEELRDWLYGETIRGSPPTLFLTESRDGQSEVFRELLGEFFYSRNEIVAQPGGIEIVIPSPYELSESSASQQAARIRQDLLNGVNHLEFRSVDDDYHELARVEPVDRDIETRLGGLPSVGPGGRIRVTRTPGAFRVTASTRAIQGVVRTNWVPSEVLDVRLAAASALLAQDGVTLRAAYGYHELSLHAPQSAVEAAVVIVAEHLGRPAWRTVFVQAVTEGRGGDVPRGMEAGPSARPPRLDSCQ